MTMQAIKGTYVLSERTFGCQPQCAEEPGVGGFVARRFQPELS
jgi:hypothetical protein